MCKKESLPGVLARRRRDLDRTRHAGPNPSPLPRWGTRSALALAAAASQASPADPSRDIQSAVETVKHYWSPSRFELKSYHESLLNRCQRQYIHVTGFPASALADVTARAY